MRRVAPRSARRVAVARARRARCGRPRPGRSTTRRAGSSRRRSPRSRPRAAADGAAGDALFLARREGRAPGSTATREQDRVTDATFDAKRGDWKVSVWWGNAGEIAIGRVDDAHRRRHRGVDGAAGRVEDGPRLQRARSAARDQHRRHLARASASSSCSGSATCAGRSACATSTCSSLLSFSVSLWFFNRGEIFTSVPLVYPPLLYLLARMVWSVVARRRPSSSRPVWPSGLLAAATVFLAGFRIGLNVRGSNVIDVGYAGVIGARPDRLTASRRTGTCPIEGTLKACGPKDADGEIRERIQTNGRCESANERGDTYGPVAYEAYVPGVRGASAGAGSGTSLPAAHVDGDRCSTCWRCSGSCWSAGASAARGSRSTLAVRLGGVPVHAVRARTRTRTTRSCRCCSILGFWLVTSPFGARRVSRARRVDEVRRAPARAALGGVSGGAPAAPERRLFAGGFVVGDARRVLDSAARAEPGARGQGLLGPDVRLAGRPRFAVLDLGLGPVPRGRDPGPRHRPADRARPARSSARSPATSCRGARRRSSSPRSPAALLIGFELVADALVLPLHPVVLPLRRLRRPGAAPAAAEAAPPPSDSEARELVPAG